MTAKLGVILDTGKTNSLGAGVGAAGIGLGGGQSRTDLYRRLAPPLRPRTSTGCYWLAATPIVFITIVLLFGLVWIGQEGGFATGMIVGILVAAVATLPLSLLMAMIAKSQTVDYFNAAGEDWDKKLAVYRDAYYCSRDDVIFTATGVRKPEDFKAEVFTEFQTPRGLEKISWS